MSDPLDGRGVLARQAALPPDRRVVVTGIGVVTSLGQNLQQFWSNLRAGRSGVTAVDRFNARAYPTWIASYVNDYAPPEFVDGRELRRMARFSQFALSAGYQALADAGLGHALEDPRAGVCMGTAVGGLDVTEETVDLMRARGGMRISPFYIVTSPCNMAAFHLAAEFRLLGYNNTCVTACAAGTQAIGEAAQVILRGDADTMLAGGTEAGLCELSVAAFSVGKAFSRRNDEPERASRPFDIDRDGFVGGEGAGLVVLERLDLARARGARIHAEVLGYGASNDAFHRIAPDPSAAGAVRAMRAALHSAGIGPEAVDYINAHATSTPLGDIAETLAIKQVLGERARTVPVSATKSMIGHLFGAAGAVEGIATMMALRDGVLPPTINLETPDPECDLDYVPNRSREVEIAVALSNSFGLGGQNAVGVFGRYDGEGARGRSFEHGTDGA
ncbi:MAG: beta-ketoacyl-ACP synthase II [Caldilineae bacterium]|nr:beta-ketoacyl-ACP synthase II [Chloroflexota bacterium]MCB9177731.1 beta-ketoacyl-ACP synthase II [Caldilineae bacterium]